MIRSNKSDTIMNMPQTTHIHCRKYKINHRVHNHWTSFYYRLWLPYCKHSFIPCVTDYLWVWCYFSLPFFLSIYNLQCIQYCYGVVLLFIHCIRFNGVLFIFICLRLMCSDWYGERYAERMSFSSICTILVGTFWACDCWLLHLILHVDTYLKDKC